MIGTHRASRYHDFSAGHRVVGHENKCRHLHGHNYRVHFHCEAQDLDEVGRVIDFSVIKWTLCDWMERYWDHKTLIWDDDPTGPALDAASPGSVVFVPFNPTAENMARYLVETVGPSLLRGTGVRLVECVVEETRKCSAGFALESQE
jgi:6-pyruvoyltetrahydropterin/6-carboxytetrahydropterin synthase